MIDGEPGLRGARCYAAPPARRAERWDRDCDPERPCWRGPRPAFGTLASGLSPRTMLLSGGTRPRGSARPWSRGSTRLFAR